MDLLDRLYLEHPIVQAGMGGGLSTAELAGAVSAAGGLGTIGIMPPRALAREIGMAQDLAPGRPIAVNLLMPFTGRAHVRACVERDVDAVVLFYGFSARIVGALRDAGILVLQQVGDVKQARRAIADGVDGLIAQGLEAGGHLLAVQPLDQALPAILDAADGRPVLAAGGIVDAERGRAVREAGAAAAVAGTRFLLTDECHAHPAYQRRVLGAERTLDTQAFGFGWPARQRVVPNAATDRWCASEDRGSSLVRAINRPTRRLGGLLPLQSMELMARAQHPRVPILSPGPALRGMPGRTIESTPLYAGTAVRDVHRIIPAAEAVRELAGVASVRR